MKAPTPKKTSLQLREGEDPAKGIRRVARQQIDHACKQLSGDASATKAVHEARKSLKKIRALLQFVKPQFSRTRLRKERGDYSKAAKLLAPMRDAEVRLAALDALVKETGIDSPEVVDVRGKLASTVTRLYARANRPKSCALEILQAARKRIPRWPLAGLDWNPLEQQIRRSYKKGRRALLAYREEPDAESFHTWRKQVKELWYQLRISRNQWKPSVARRITELEKIGELAGRANDFILLQDLLAAKVPSLAVAIQGRHAELQEKSLQLGSRFYKAKPREFMRRLARN